MTRTLTRTLIVLMLVVSLLGSAAGPAAAENSSDTIIDFEISPNSNATLSETAMSVLSGLTGIVDRRSVGAWVTDLRDEEPTPASQTDRLRTFVNNHSQSFVDHSNKVLDHYNANVSNTTYVLELTVRNAEGGGASSSTIYVVAAADGSNITSLKATNSTSKTVDKSKTLRWSQAEDLNEDVREYHEEYVTTGEIPEEEYIAEKVGKYGDFSSIQESDDD